MENKIAWLEWGKESFTKAKLEQKPLLLDIMAVWCYWCKRLDKDTYEKKEVIEFVNRNFIAIKVDTDKRPDINIRYNLGGWPTTAILNQEGEIISGSMYLPPLEMLSFLENALLIFKKPAVKREYPEFKEKRFNNPDLNKLQDQIFNEIKVNYDPYFGGFGSDQKFPFHNILEFLLQLNSKESREMLIKTLTNMADGEIFDKEEGGFYRYSTQQNWSQPHYEKLLDDNARLISSYLLAYKLTNIEKFKQTALKTIEFILTNFLSIEGYFFSSQDADEEYSNLTFKERQKTKKPFIDETLFVDSNSYTINAFLLASEILSNEKYKEIAKKCLDFLLTNLVTKKGVMHFYNYSSNPLYLLKNHLLLIDSLLSSNQDNYMEKAEEIMKKTIENFYENNLFYDIIESDDNLGYLKKRKIDPEQNALAIKVLINLYKKEYLELAEKTINSIKDYIDPQSVFSASFAEVIELIKPLSIK